MRAALRGSSGGGYSPGVGSCLAFLGLLFVVAIAIPNLLPARCGGSSETAAIATLRNLAACQAEMQTSSRIDVDGDRAGEYGTFAEMTGYAGVRANADGSARGERVAPPVLSPALAGVGEDGIVIKSGYCFRLFLPGGGRAVREGRPGERLTGPVASDAAEVRWCAYTWPLQIHERIQRVFFVDEGGEVLQSANADGRYEGRERGPAWDAAMVTEGWSTAWTHAAVGEILGKSPSRDGNVWKITN